MKGKMMNKIILSTLCIAILGGTSALAQDRTSVAAAKEKLAKFNQTGQFENCISQNAIKNATIIDDTMIMFELRNNKHVLNTLDGQCRRLGFNRQFGYPSGRSKICSNDFITTSRGPCGLGQFEVLEEKS